jgi:hypothetical protein
MTGDRAHRVQLSSFRKPTGETRMPTGMSAEELRDHLSRGSELPTPVTLVGFVEAGDEGCLSFSPGVSCEKWVQLPLSLVLEAAPLGVRRCNDHAHELVRLELKIPDNPEARAMQALMETTRRESNHVERNSRLLIRLQEFLGTTSQALPQVSCDSIGDIVICTQGDNVCWWSPRSGYHCN